MAESRSLHIPMYFLADVDADNRMNEKKYGRKDFCRRYSLTTSHDLYIEVHGYTRLSCD